MRYPRRCPRPTIERPADVLQQNNRASKPPSGLSEVAPVYLTTASPLVAPASPSPALREHFRPEQRALFLRVRALLPLHLRGVAFGVHGTGSTPEAIEQLGGVLCIFLDVFTKSNSDVFSCSLMSFVISAPEGSAPVPSRPHSIKRIVTKEAEVTLDRYLAAGLTSPWSSPLGVIPKKSGGVRVTVNYKKLNQISSLGKLPIPGVGQLLDFLSKGRLFSLFNLVSSFHQSTAHKDTVSLTAF